jgi:arsenate reductase (thioredoxin)
MTADRPPFRILAICQTNAGRSRLAEAIIDTRGLKRPMGTVQGFSAGIRPLSSVNEYTLVTLHNAGFGAIPRTTRALAGFEGETFDLVITLCDASTKACPRFAGARAQVQWLLPDPVQSITPATVRVAFSDCFDALTQRINALLRLPLESLTAVELEVRAQAIHDELVAPAERSSIGVRGHARDTLLTPVANRHTMPPPHR